jgi:hypothetical protein
MFGQQIPVAQRKPARVQRQVVVLMENVLAKVLVVLQITVNALMANVARNAVVKVTLVEGI